MRAFLLFALLSLLFSSCEVHFPQDINSGYEENPFTKRIELSDGSEGDSLSFLVFTDAHIGRHDEGTVDRSQELLAALAEGVFDAVLNMGDTSDNGASHNTALQDFLLRLSTSNVPVISVLGNHELHSDHGKERWSKLYAELGILGPIGCYRFSDDLSIYALDSSLRLYGSAQLDALEEALESDDARYKIFMTHIDTASGESLSHALFFSLGLAEIKEMDRLYSLMDEYNVGLMFSGHRHKGGGLITHRGFYEFNLDALHTRKPSPIESEGCWYTCNLDLSTGSLTITRHLAENPEEAAGAWTVSL